MPTGTGKKVDWRPQIFKKKGRPLETGNLDFGDYFFY